MADALETLREQAWNHVRRVIGDHFMYNDHLAGDDIFRMSASDATEVLAMTEGQMAARWAIETDYEADYDQARKKGYR